MLARFDYEVDTTVQRIRVAETNENDATTTIDGIYDELGRLLLLRVLSVLSGSKPSLVPVDGLNVQGKGRKETPSRKGAKTPGVVPDFFIPPVFLCDVAPFRLCVSFHFSEEPDEKFSTQRLRDKDGPSSVHYPPSRDPALESYSPSAKLDSFR